MKHQTNLYDVLQYTYICRMLTCHAAAQTGTWGFPFSKAKHLEMDSGTLLEYPYEIEIFVFYIVFPLFYSKILTKFCQRVVTHGQQQYVVTYFSTFLSPKSQVVV